MTDRSLEHLFAPAGDAASSTGSARLVEERRGVAPTPLRTTRSAGLYLSDEVVDQILAGPSTAYEPDDAALRAELDRRPSAAAGDEPRLLRLARMAGLTPLDVDLLVIAALPDLDSRFERLYGYLNDDVTRRRASVGLALELAGEHPASAAGPRPAHRRRPACRPRAAERRGRRPAVPDPRAACPGPGHGAPARRRRRGPPSCCRSVYRCRRTHRARPSALAAAIRAGVRAGPRARLARPAPVPAWRRPPWPRPAAGVVGIDLDQLAGEHDTEALVRTAGAGGAAARRRHRRRPRRGAGRARHLEACVRSRPSPSRSCSSEPAPGTRAGRSRYRWSWTPPRWPGRSGSRCGASASGRRRSAGRRRGRADGPLRARPRRHHPGGPRRPGRRTR